MMPPRPPLNVIKLSDHFGQYVLTISCECGHTRTARPQTLARFAGGWDALLVDVVKANEMLAMWRPEMQRERAPGDKARRLGQRAAREEYYWRP